MTEQHIAICERCKKKQKMRCYVNFIGDLSYKLPRGWANIQKNWFYNADICKECLKDFKKTVKEFLQ